MIQALKSEFRKLFTIRSTYVIMIVSIFITMLFAGYIEGFRATQPALSNPDLLAGESKSAVLFIGLIVAIVGLMLFGHEYRYNTVMYTLTATNRRLKPYFAKALAITLFAVGFGLFITFFSPLCTIVGARLQGLTVGPQTFNLARVVARCLFCMWGYSMYAFVIVALVRSQVGAIVSYLLIPLIGENILIALLRDNAKYLPFTSLQNVASPGMLNASKPIVSALISSTYIIVGLAVGAVLFVRRDAN